MVPVLDAIPIIALVDVPTVRLQRARVQLDHPVRTATGIVLDDLSFGEIRGVEARGVHAGTARTAGGRLQCAGLFDPGFTVRVRVVIQLQRHAVVAPGGMGNSNAIGVLLVPDFYTTIKTL